MQHTRYALSMATRLLVLADGPSSGASHSGRKVPSLGPSESPLITQPLRLLQLIAAQGVPANLPNTTYVAMASPTRCAQIGTYADGLGVELSLIITN
jgi:hypothetical protein